MKNWVNIYQENSSIFTECCRIVEVFELHTKSNQKITIKIYEMDNGIFFAASDLYPKALDAAGTYHPSGINGNSKEEALDNLLKAWRTQYTGCDPANISWED